jgi:hypothetical protein
VCGQLNALAALALGKDTAVPLDGGWVWTLIIIIIIIIDVAISGDRNVIKKEAEKILKYKDLTIEIQRM